MTGHGQPPGPYGSVPAPGTFRIERLLPGPIERVWEFLTDPAKRQQWFAGGPTELRATGRVALEFRFSELTSESTPPGRDAACDVRGHVTRCEPPCVLSFTWGEGSDASEVTFELTPRGHDVLLVVTHRRLDPRQMIAVASGWHTHLDMLTDTLLARRPRPFWSTKARMETDYGERFAG